MILRKKDRMREEKNRNRGKKRGGMEFYLIVQRCRAKLEITFPARI